jgi:hypothetical protein
MSEPNDLSSIMARAGDAFIMFIALQEAGFEKPEALSVLNTMLLTGATRRPPAEA